MRRGAVQAALGASAGAAVVLAGACGGNGPATLETPPLDAGALDAFAAGQGVGQPCGPDLACRAGLACNGTCAPGHASGTGAACLLSDECVAGDYCGPARACAPAGSGTPGATCGSDADCASGLRCVLVGLSAQCAPEGTADLGAACATSGGCLGGLVCFSGACAAPSSSPGAPAPIAAPAWPGVACSDEPPPLQAYFRVPRGTGDGDFFRLPFPNDVRRASGKLDLSGFPTPGSDLLGYDLVARYVADVEATEDGFGTYPTITMRFSGAVSFDSLKATGALAWLELPASGGATPIGFVWTATTGRNQYVCTNSLSARPQLGAPLKPGTTYAFVVSRGVVAADGSPLAVPSDLAALLAASPPTEPALAAAYPRYKPLRDWAAANPSHPILDATVFTTAHPTALVPAAVQAVTGAPAAPVSTWTLCDGAHSSPCPQASGDRGCPAKPDPNFDELHALVSLPIVQRGSEPYATPDDDGDVPLDPSGAVSVVRSEPICLALTVPKGPTPATGWPVVVYAHGTGGSFRSHVTEGVAARLAAARGSSGTSVPMAVLGIDQVEHGPRRGASQASPETLFFDFGNPHAARGNPVQGAADQASLVKLVKTLTVDASITGSAIKLGAVAFWGHSQGATEGALAMPYVPGVAGVVLSGEGASLLDALLTKRRPVDVADVVPVALEDTAVDVYHPALALLQAALDPADPLNHAAGLAASPVAGMKAKHVFQPYGLGDTYAPPVTQQTFAIAAGLGVAAPPASAGQGDSIGGRTPVPVPASGNLAGTPAVTALVREYRPVGYDGHFVAYEDADAKLDVAQFLADAVSGQVPKVGH